MNKVVLTGRLVRDAELSYIASTATPKMSFSMAVERAYQKDKNNKKVDFINCEMIGKHTENLCQYVTKGKQILVEGELNIDNYEKDGEKRSPEPLHWAAIPNSRSDSRYSPQSEFLLSDRRLRPADG